MAKDKPKKPQTFRVVKEGYSDESIRGGLRERPETYSGKKGSRDIVRLITVPIYTYGARVQFKNNPDKGFFAYSNADPELIESGDLEEAKRQCPLVRHGYKMARRFVTLLLHVKRIDGKGREKEVKAVLPWHFGGEKYSQLRNIESTLGMKTLKDGKTVKRTLLDVELSIETTDEQFQKQNIAAIPKPSMTHAEVKEIAAEYFDEGKYRDPLACDLIKETVEPDSPADTEASIARANGSGEMDEEDVDDDEKPASKKPQGGKKDEDDDLDDLIGDDEDDESSDGSDSDDEAEESPKPAAKKPQGSKPGKIKPGKPKKKPADDDELDDESETTVVDDDE